MFNTYHDETHKFIDQSPENIQVDEHRAATDESIKLSEEYYQKCLSQIIKGFRGGSNELRFGAVVCKERHTGYDYIVRINFSLNGKEYDIDIDFSPQEMHALNYENFVEMIYEKISEKITEEIMDGLGKELVYELPEDCFK